MYTSPPQTPLSNTWIEASFNILQYAHIPQVLPTLHNCQTPAVNMNDCHHCFVWKATECAINNWKFIFTTIPAELKSDKMQINTTTKHSPQESSVELKFKTL